VFVTSARPAVAKRATVRPSVQEKMDVGIATRPREIVFTWAGILVTFGAVGLVTIGFLDAARLAVAHRDMAALVQQLVFAALVAALIYGGLVYLFARLAFLRRLRAHVEAPAPDPDRSFAGAAPSLTVLVPSYKEERRVVEMTLLSAALQDFPARLVVLLLDDPPRPTDRTDALRLEDMRRLPLDIEEVFRPPLRRMSRERDVLERLLADGTIDLVAAYGRLATSCIAAAAWLQERIDAFVIDDHASAFFAERVLVRRRDELLERSIRARQAARRPVVDVAAEAEAVRRAFGRLVDMFDVRLTSFERKRYANLSHEPNKAMNLNAYLAAMGRRFDERRVGDDLYLEASSDGAVIVPWADYVMTLDADSVVLGDYARRLVEVMEGPDGERVAVVQTPYSAYPGAPNVLERIAGATTDMQYIIHQGFAGHGATYWVGANALLRRAALEDIATRSREGEFSVTRYIQDRTVIEDTESTIDLVAAGWRLYNYPERLAYSATPPDFGSLAVQRGRWANGGLLILPKLLRYLLRLTPGRPTFGEGFMRLHYLISIAMVNVALVVLLAVPIVDADASPWLPLTAIPYYVLYTRDLVLLGYKVSDVLKVYALNVLLIPVNLLGVATSIGQAVRRTKVPFLRTPKVGTRTASPAALLGTVVALAVHWLVSAGFDVAGGRTIHGAFAALHGMVLVYALVHFIGVGNVVADLVRPWRERQRRGSTRLPRPGDVAWLPTASLEVAPSPIEALPAGAGWAVTEEGRQPRSSERP
jgi:cellulose synthase (UDP-forming)